MTRHGPASKSGRHILFHQPSIPLHHPAWCNSSTRPPPPAPTAVVQHPTPLPLHLSPFYSITTPPLPASEISLWHPTSVKLLALPPPSPLNLLYHFSPTKFAYEREMLVAEITDGGAQRITSPSHPYGSPVRETRTDDMAGSSSTHPIVISVGPGGRAGAPTRGG